MKTSDISDFGGYHHRPVVGYTTIVIVDARHRPPAVRWQPVEKGVEWMALWPGDCEFLPLNWVPGV